MTRSELTADQCPRCFHTAVEGGSVEVSEHGCTQKCYCLDCDAQWISCFEFTHTLELRAA